jgi:hypothetical protein
MESGSFAKSEFSEQIQRPALAALNSTVSRVLVLTFALGYGMAVDPHSGAGGIPCLWKALSGWKCPGCGLTRAWAFLVRGQFFAAFQMNCLIFLTVPIFLKYLLFERRR